MQAAEELADRPALPSIQRAGPGAHVAQVLQPAADPIGHLLAPADLHHHAGRRPLDRHLVRHDHQHIELQPVQVGTRLLALENTLASPLGSRPAAASVAFRELGITLFLACVGLKAGEKFVKTVLTPEGLSWLGMAALITLVPMLIVGLFGRLVWKLNFMTLSGLLAGSMTDPPALAFAAAVAKSDAPHVSYATVYPLTMLLRIVTAQVLALLLTQG